MQVNFVNPNPPQETGEQALERLRVQAANAAARVQQAEACQQERKRKREEQLALQQARQAKELCVSLQEETVKERARFQLLFREAASSLGRIARSAQLIAQAANAYNALIPDPELSAAARAAARPPCVEVLLDGTGLVPVTSVGWNWKITVPPCVPKEEQL